MCGKFRTHTGKVYRVGDTIATRSGRRLIWDGFARSESLDKWLQGGWEERVLKVADFAERHRETQQDVWSGNGEHRLKVLVFNDHMRIVTREATPQEAQYFGHHRLPVEVNHG